MSLTPADFESDFGKALLQHKLAVFAVFDYFMVHAKAAKQDGNLARATALMEYADTLDATLTSLSRAHHEMANVRCTQKQGETPTP